MFGITLLGEEYAPGLGIVPIVLLAYVGYGVYVNFIVGVYLEKKTGYLPFVTGLGALVSILGNWLLIPHWGIVGSAWATCLAYGTMAVALYLVSRRLYPIPYEFFRVMKLVVLIGLLFFLGTSVLAETMPMVRLLLLIVLFPLLWVVRFFGEEERVAMRRVLRKIFG